MWSGRSPSNVLPSPKVGGGVGVGPMSGRLKGKSCVVTGAAFGIGRATAIRFAEEGARLVVTDIQEAPVRALTEELRGNEAEVEAVAGDVSVPDDARRMIGAAVDRYGRLDVLVANAGIIPLGD